MSGLNPLLVKAQCSCGNVWNAFMPNGIHRGTKLECPKCRKMDGMWDMSKIEEALDYWNKHLNSHCESVSPRDHLAIMDIGLFIEELKSLRQQRDRMREALEESKILLVNLMFACVQANICNDVLKKHEGIGVRINNALKDVGEGE